MLLCFRHAKLVRRMACDLMWLTAVEKNDLKPLAICFASIHFSPFISNELHCGLPFDDVG